MKKKTPKTIADLKINWTICKGEGNTPIPESKVFAQFRELNPKICDIVIKQNCYTIIHAGKYFVIYSTDQESVCSFITYLNYLIWEFFEESIKLKKFVRVSDTEYILYGE